MARKKKTVIPPPDDSIPSEGKKASVSKTPRVDEDDLLTTCAQEMSAALGSNSTSTNLTNARLDAYKYYMGDFYGDELDGRSQVVTTEVRDTIESILPQLMKIFTSSDEIVQFTPTEDQPDEKVAQQATDACNYVFMKDNPGFLIMYEWFKDALMLKNGIIKIWWDERPHTRNEKYIDLLESELTALLQNEDITPKGIQTRIEMLPQGVDPVGNPMNPVPVKLYSVQVTRSYKKGRICIETVPPDEFLISQRTASIQAARYCAHRTRKTSSDLREMGISQDLIDQCKGADEGEFNIERVQRWLGEDDTTPYSPFRADAAADVWVTEHYLLYDSDDDGVAERWKVLTGGSKASVLLSKEEWDGDWPFESITPTPMPHKFFGLSEYDLIKDIQRIKSTLTRQLLDNVYNINNNRMVVVDGQVNLDDVLTVRPNGIIRAMRTDAILPLQPQPIQGVIMPALEYLDTLQEQRTGVTKYNQGLDADSLNKTATGVSRIMAAAQERVLLIARIFAETGVKGLFQQILRLLCRYQDKKRMIRLRGEWVPMDPSEWNDQMDVTVNVALGTNNKQEQLMHLQQILTIQQQAMGTPLVTMDNIYHTLGKLVENAGLKSVDTYFTDPKKNPQTPQPSIDEKKLQASMAEAQLRAQTDTQIAQLQAKVDIIIEQMKLGGQQQTLQAEHQMQRDGQAMDAAKMVMDSGQQPAPKADAKPKADKKRPTRLQIVRNPQTREVEQIVPQYDGQSEDPQLTMPGMVENK